MFHTASVVGFDFDICRNKINNREQIVTMAFEFNGQVHCADGYRANLILEFVRNMRHNFI